LTGTFHRAKRDGAPIVFAEGVEPVVSPAHNQTSAFIPGTSAHNYPQGKRVLYLKEIQAETVGRLAREYGRILGFEK
jgi:hypothetical protein